MVSPKEKGEDVRKEGEKKKGRIRGTVLRSKHKEIVGVQECTHGTRMHSWSKSKPILQYRLQDGTEINETADENYTKSIL